MENTRTMMKWFRLAAAVMLIMLLTAAVQAQDAVCSDGVCLGTGPISNPATGSADGFAVWSGSYVYYGKYESNPVLYRVLSKNESNFGGKTLLLDCDSILDKRLFDDDSNVWVDSEVKTWLNGTFLNENFDDAERDAIADSIKNSDAGTDGAGWSILEWTPLTGEKIFLLDAKEATNTTYGYRNSYYSDSARIKNLNGSPDWWWLRSPIEYNADLAGFVHEGGSIYYDFVGSTGVGVSPAFNVNLSSVIFSSEIPSESDHYKLSLLDQDLVIALPSGESASIKGSTVTVPYSITGADAAIATRVMVVVTDGAFGTSGWTEDAVIKQIAFPSDLSDGKVSIDLNSDLNISQWGSTYHVYLIAEDVNEGNLTNYASAPVELAAPDHVHDWTYAGDGSVITASCSTTGHTGGDAVLTLSAADNLTYDGTGKEASYSITPVDSDAFGTPEIVCKQGETVLSSAPVKTGDYTASVTLSNVKTAAGEGQSVTASLNFTIKPKEVTVAGITAADRVYEPGKLSVELSGGTVNGKIGDDDVSADLSSAAGTVASADAGENKAVTVTGVKLAGAAAGNYSLTEQPADVTVTISKAENPAVIDTSVSLRRGGRTLELADFVSDAIGEVTFAIDGDANGCSLSGSVLTSGEKSGSCSVTVTIAGNENYLGMSGTITVTITEKEPQNLSFAESSVTKTWGDDAFVNPLSGAMTDVSYEVSEGSDAASVGADGTVTILKAGTAVVTASAAETEVYDAASASFTLTVLEKDICGGQATLSGTEFDYDGELKQVSVTSVKLADGTALTEADYAVSGELSGREAKVYTVTVSGQGNYTGSVSAEWKILKRGFTVIWKNHDGTVLETDENVPEGTMPVYDGETPVRPDAGGYTYAFSGWDPELTAVTGDAEYTAVFEKRNRKPDWHYLFRPGEELPGTGISAAGETVRLKVSDLYSPVNMELLIPGLERTAEIVLVPHTEEGYPVRDLGMNAGLLEGFALPGSGISVIAGHNTLDQETYGPFAAILLLETGDRFFVRQEDGGLLGFEVYANEKIASADVEALRVTAEKFENTLTLLTCEDERPDGGYASRRIVAAKAVEL